MRLITHNMLICNRINCSKGYPLKIVLDDGPGSFKIDTQPINPEFVKRILPRLDYKALYSTASSLQLDLPQDYLDDDLENESFINAIHDALINYHILEGKLICPSCSWEYTINKGIPDMIHPNADE